VELALAKEATLLVRLLGQIKIDLLQQLVYLLICQMVLAPTLCIGSIHTSIRREKAPAEQALRGLKPTTRTNQEN
jgi:hypothetical protein